MKTRTWLLVGLAGLMVSAAGIALAKEAAAVKDAAKEAKDKSQTIGARVDEREANQAKRIQRGIDKGYLTADEIATLEAQEQSIASLEASAKSDGKLSKEDRQKLVGELNLASRCIWAQKHDTEGAQMPVLRLGRNVFAKDDLTSKLQDVNLPIDQVKALLKDFRQTVELKRKLAGDASGDERTKLQAQYDDLLNKYFEVRTPAAKAVKATKSAKTGSAI